MSDNNPSAGPTGEFPRGKLKSDDEGALLVAVAADRARNAVVLEFGKPVAWLAWSPDEVRQIALALLRKASELDGKILEVRTR